MNRKLPFLFTLLLILLIGGGGAEQNDINLNVDSAGNTSLTLIIANSTIIEGDLIPTEFTCSGSGLNPEVSWQGIPTGTESLVFVIDDPDAPAGTFTHWIVYNLSPQNQFIPENFSPESSISGVKMGINSVQENNYFPPCPPSGQEHHYLFSLYALNSTVNGENLDRDHIDAAMEGHVIEYTRITTTFKK